MKEFLIALCLHILRTCSLSTFSSQYIILLNVYLFHGHVPCLPLSRYTILLSGTLYVGKSNCFMSTYFMGMLLVHIFHSILFYFQVHYI